MKPKGRKNCFTVVPWINPEQFNKVYNYLYSNSLVKKRWAVDQISVWKTRCHPSLPTAVEATVAIVGAQIQEMLYDANKNLCRESDVQLFYAIALTRFVCLTLEHHQKGTSKISLSVLAAKHNLPDWLVDVRNEAVHSHCPSLSVLRSGAESALKYLEETFWSIEATNQKLIVILPSTLWEAKALSLIHQYRSLQIQKIKDEELMRQLSKDLKGVLLKINTFIFQDGEKFIDILVQPGNFISVEDLEKLMSVQGILGWFEESELSVPVDLQKFWCPLLRSIHDKELMPMFLEKLLLAQEECHDKRCQKMAISWAKEIFLGAASTSLIARCFQKKGVLLYIPSLVYACVKSVTPYSRELLTLILYNCPDKEKYSKLFFILALYQGYFIPKEDLSLKPRRKVDLDIIYTVDDLEDKLNESIAKKMRTETDENNWSLPSATMDFSDIPFGRILNPVIPDASQEEKSPVDSWKDQLKIEPSVDDDWIIVDENDEGTIEEIADDINTFTETTIPEDFDMIYRKRPKK